MASMLTLSRTQAQGMAQPLVFHASVFQVTQEACDWFLLSSPPLPPREQNLVASQLCVVCSFLVLPEPSISF